MSAKNGSHPPTMGDLTGLFEFSYHLEDERTITIMIENILFRGCSDVNGMIALTYR